MNQLGPATLPVAVAVASIIPSIRARQMSARLGSGAAGEEAQAESASAASPMISGLTRIAVLLIAVGT